MAWPKPISGMSIVNAFAFARDVEITRDIRFAAGRRGLLDVYAPTHAHNAPMAVFFYGGSWEFGDRADYRFVAMALAKRGIVTIVPDYRLYPDVRFPDFIHDGAKAVRWAQRNAAEFGGDPALTFLVGHSAGAYIAAMLVLNEANLDTRGRSALAGMIGLAGPYDFLPLESGTLKRIFAPAGGDLSSSQPITYARGDAAPMLLATGLSDTTVKPDNTSRLASRIRAYGGLAETRFYRRVDHTVLIGAFSPLLRPLAPSLGDTLAFIKTRSDMIRPKPDLPYVFQANRLA